MAFIDSARALHGPAPGHGAPGRPGSAHRVAIVSASVGAGHDGAAAELARRLTGAGAAVDRVDLLDLLPARLGRAVNDAYRGLLIRAPWVYQRVYNVTQRAGGAGPSARSLLRAAEEPLLRALRPGTGAVVSTYPGASAVLGTLRRDGRLRVPALTYLTDFSVHPLWVAPGVDVHLAAHAVPAAQARALGAAGVAVTGPVVDPRFRPAGAGERAAARARFGLPPHRPLALLVAGSWGVGPVARVAREIRDSGAAEPVVVCGRNEGLARRLRARGLPHVFGWVGEMPALAHACDVLVQNAGGLSSLEAMAAGLPVASYRCIPGHGPANAEALHEAGVALWIRDPDRLSAALRDLMDGDPGRRHRAAGLALFPERPQDGPAAMILGACDGTAEAAAPAHPGTATRNEAGVRAVSGASEGMASGAAVPGAVRTPGPPAVHGPGAVPAHLPVPVQLPLPLPVAGSGAGVGGPVAVPSQRRTLPRHLPAGALPWQSVAERHPHVIHPEVRQP